MKNKSIKLLMFSVTSAMMLFLSSCGTGYAIITNHNVNNTQVNLGSDNFKVVGKVSGNSQTGYVFFLGGNKKRQLYENAYSNMLDKANLTGTSKTVINVVSEEHIGGVPPFYFKRTITVSGYVVEFVK